ncbi:hypothetical protein C8Q80DRAFT_1187778 [Daedaleopsis nitida]|nr:hypothetical protein C8Q80DRAFT_1187778 [Daedaleopsis nitida]
MRAAGDLRRLLFSSELLSLPPVWTLEHAHASSMARPLLHCPATTGLGLEQLSICVVSISPTLEALRFVEGCRFNSFYLVFGGEHSGVCVITVARTQRRLISLGCLASTRVHGRLRSEALA